MTASGQISDHDKIRHWIEERGGHPARAAGNEQRDSVRVDFDESKAISWEEFFRAFDHSRLTFLHRADTARRH